MADAFLRLLAQDRRDALNVACALFLLKNPELLEGPEDAKVKKTLARFEEAFKRIPMCTQSCASESR